MTQPLKNVFRFIFVGALLLSFLLTLDIFIANNNEPSFQAFPPPGTTPPYPPPGDFQSTPTPINETCYVDHLNRFSLRLLSGWRTDGPPDIDAVGGASVFYNYTADDIKSNHGLTELPSNAVKVQVSSAKIAENWTFEQWINAAIQTTKPSSLSKSYGTSTTTPYPYELATYKGMAYSVSDLSGTNALVVNLEIKSDRVLIITILPANTPALSQALSMLSTLNAEDFENCSSGTFAPDEQRITVRPTKRKLYYILSPEDFFCNLGTFPGTEAYNSTITMQMPFLIGETWIVGGAGSFYGNHHHCNYYNNYYATDWNKQGGDDQNSLVLAIANGTVSAIDIQCTASRYGCYVQVDHTSNYRTLYAHLSSVHVQSGANVIVGQLIGKVGCTGNCDDPHLHLSFWHLDQSGYPYHYDFFSQCYNGGQTCPNGEAPYFPQGYRPSPMWTNYGNAILPCRWYSLYKYKWASSLFTNSDEVIFQF